MISARLGVIITMTANDVGGEDAAVLTVVEAAGVLRISRNLAYDLIAQGRLPHLRLGRRILIPRQGLELWIAKEAGLPPDGASGVSFSQLRGRPQLH